MRAIFLFLFFSNTMLMPLFAHAVRLDNETIILHNKEAILPLKNLDQQKIAVFVPNRNSYRPFTAMLNRYSIVDKYYLSGLTSASKEYQTIIVVGRSYEIDMQVQLDLQRMEAEGKNIIVCTFAGNSDLRTLRFGGQVTEVTTGKSSDDNQKNMAMSLFGGLAVTKGLRDFQTTQIRLNYNLTNKFNHQLLEQKIDKIAMEAIAKKATPGMVVMAIKDNQLLFEKSYGYHTYEKQRKTADDDIFDLASVSKIVGTTPVIMHLVEQGKIDLNKQIGDYLEDARGTNKSNISLRTVLLHEAGFIPFIPFYKNLKTGDLQNKLDADHHVKVADSLYLKTDYYHQVMWPEMLHSAVKATGSYVYSDISMYVMKEIAEAVTASPMPEYVAKFLYKPIGMTRTGYNPRDRFAKDQIVPTENDLTFRGQLLRGYVHDQGAAMAGGVAGHAGLFGTANDLAIYGQMLLNRGEYGAIRYFKQATVDLFTSKQSKGSRRGLGFDRYDPDRSKYYPSRLANNTVYGHTGYTGTCIWIDPKNQFVYIFLSNRVHPQVTSKLIDLNIRGRIQDAIYETILPK